MQELEKILEEIKSALKEIYLDIANNYDISDLSFDDSKAACVASKFRCDARRRIEKIIRKHMNDGWIPVEKALPEYGKKVLAYGKSGEIDIASLYSRDKHMWLVGSMCSVAFDIIAWRTLPAPYRPERSNNHDGE